MLNKDQVFEAMKQGKIEVDPWQPGSISDSGKITLHLAEDVHLEAAVHVDMPVHVNIETVEAVRISYDPFFSKDDNLNGLLEPTVFQGVMWVGPDGRADNGIEVHASGPVPLNEKVHVRVQIINKGAKGWVLKKGDPIATISFEPLRRHM